LLLASMPMRFSSGSESKYWWYDPTHLCVLGLRCLKNYLGD
jgi:hypothetical protein